MIKMDETDRLDRALERAYSAGYADGWRAAQVASGYAIGHDATDDCAYCQAWIEDRWGLPAPQEDSHDAS